MSIIDRQPTDPNPGILDDLHREKVTYITNYCNVIKVPKVLQVTQAFISDLKKMIRHNKPDKRKKGL